MKFKTQIICLFRNTVLFLACSRSRAMGIVANAISLLLGVASEITSSIVRVLYTSLHIHACTHTPCYRAAIDNTTAEIHTYNQ